MDRRQFMLRLEEILEDAKTAVLATVDNQGCPHMRWMTPTILRGREGLLFAVTTPATGKILHLEVQPEVEWMIQTRALTEVINLRGIMQVVDNPALKTEIMEVLGAWLNVFWKVNPNRSDFIVTETLIREASYFQPMKGQRLHVVLQEPAPSH
ncbi:MAG: pyridoxamine 5'-phosphate oxidase family protein [Sedimentisphaerales bacterium]|nr:pyridoxamine 5'-phosphate oxidase family protein [Sedimentisphaerales bacterium]